MYVTRIGDWQDIGIGVTFHQFSLLLWAGLGSPARVFLGGRYRGEPAVNRFLALPRIQPGARLPAGCYKLTLIADGRAATSFASETRYLGAKQGFTMEMLPYGGFVATLEPAK